MNLDQLEKLLENVLPAIASFSKSTHNTTSANHGKRSTEKRKVYLRIWLTETEKQELQQRCGGQKLSTFARGKLLDLPVPKPQQVVPQINRETYVELGRIGNNLNQSLRTLHCLYRDTYQAIAQPDLTPNALAKINQLRDTISQNIEIIQELSGTLQKLRAQTIGIEEQSNL